MTWVLMSQYDFIQAVHCILPWWISPSSVRRTHRSKGLGTQSSLWRTQASNICIAIVIQVAFPAFVLLQLSRHPQNEAQHWVVGNVANDLSIEKVLTYIDEKIYRSPFYGFKQSLPYFRSHHLIDKLAHYGIHGIVLEWLVLEPILIKMV